MEIFKIENLTYFYPEAANPAISDINLCVNEGEFLLIVGPSGGGKTTLARIMAGLIPDFYGGRINGRISFKGVSLAKLKKGQLQKEVGMVFQNPERQLIMGKVESEIAFGLENLGVEPDEIKRRIAEVSVFFGLSSLLDTQCEHLSGGEKQKLALASILAMGPKVIILDEPTSQLDPIAAEEVFQALRRLKDDFGYTIILIEQRLDRCFCLCDRIILLEDGRVAQDSDARNFASWAVKEKSDFIPLFCKLFSSHQPREVPLAVAQARKLIGNYNGPAQEIKTETFSLDEKLNAIEVKGVSYLYEKGTVALKNVNLSIKQNDFLCILGENGAGKSTLLKIMCGLLKPAKGKTAVLGGNLFSLSNVERAKIIGYLSQNPNDYLFNDSVEKELEYTLNNLDIEDDGVIENTLNLLEINQHKYKNPRELSTGERERVALASVIVAQPQILLLDEPTRGLNFQLKERLGKILHSFIEQNNGTVIMITQDVDFASEFAKNIALLFKGEIVGCGNKYDILKGNLYYSSCISRLFYGIADNIVTLGEARQWIKASYQS